ncbi:MAG TPA: molybdate ABC transporter permease subunit [Polyangiaceae bacterium]|nr:molybdate ABC transporter permease subunit [Polyangiaceae bacterium]
MTVDPSDLRALALTLRLALWTILWTFALGTPLAYWLASGHSRGRSIVSACTLLPLAIPPTVLGFYLLGFFGPRGWGGQSLAWLGVEPLVFSFAGLVVASSIGTLPFVVQPLIAAFRGVGRLYLEAAATLRMGPWARFFWVALPLSRHGFTTGLVLAFTHTLGEFGVVLMLGGNVPGQTRVLSIALYERVEALDYGRAHALAAILIGLSLAGLVLLWAFESRRRHD